jgi:hypothetical protein
MKVCIGVIALALISAGPPADLFATLGLTPQEIAAIDAGEPDADPWAARGPNGVDMRGLHRCSGNTELTDSPFGQICCSL